MASSVLELAVNTGRWEAGLNKAQKALNNFTSQQGGLQQALQKDSGYMQKFVQMMGKIDSTAGTARGQMNDYKRVLEQLTADYNKMSVAQQKSIGQDYLQTIDALKQKFQAAKQQVEDFNRSLGETSNAKMTEVTGGGGFLSGDKFSGMLQVLGGNLMTKAVSMVGNLAMEMGDLVGQGIQLAQQGEGIRMAFERLGRGDLLEGLRKSTHNTVSDLELMKAAVQFNDFKLPLDELGTMLAFAQQKAKDTGQSVDYMVSSIVTGLGRKSKLILDNLGLSAAQIDEKMKETGDMTKAVGEIIREQMANAGDYIETAADKATQANVELKNAMINLGNTLQPLTTNFNTFWNDIKVGGINFLNDVIAPMILQLTEAGRKMNAINGMGGNEKVNAQIDTLRSGSTRQEQMEIYRNTNNEYVRQIGEYQTMIANGGKKPGAGSGESRSVRWLQAQVEGLQQMRAEFEQKAKDILFKPVVVDSPEVKSGDNKTDKKDLTKKETYTPAIGSIDEMTAKVKALQDEFNKTADHSIRGQLLSAIDEAQRHLDFMRGKGLSQVEKPSGSLSEHLGIGGVNTKEELKKIKVPQEFIQGGKAAATAWGDALNAVSGLGSALSGIEDPAVRVFAIVAEAVANVALAFSKSLKGTFSPWEFIAGAAAGTATMISTIAAIKSATSGFASGGIIPGNSMSGDNLRGMTPDGKVFGINSGELILNSVQQNAVASLLQGAAANRQVQVYGRLSGEDIIISADRAGRRKGYGELMFGKNL